MNQQKYIFSKEWKNSIPQQGVVEWIGIRPGKRMPMKERSEVELIPGKGLSGDHFTGSYDCKREVTLFQHEHLEVISHFLKKKEIEPHLLRRNIIVSGINLMPLKNRKFKIGNIILEGTGICAPCSRMEENLGLGGYNAVRGHGGITARLITGGVISIGDDVDPKV